MNYSYTHSGFVLLYSLLSFLCLISCGDGQSQAPEGFVIHPDFQLELAAAEPLVFDPVDMEFDEQGRAFVLEMPGYPLHDEQSRLVLLEDKDNDGVFDQRHVYADSLSLASSFMPYKGGMLVASPPYLLFLTDENGDKTADKTEVLMEGFELGNLQHNFNGLTYGLDNWIYAANGGNSGAPFYAGDSTTRLPLRGDDFRFKWEDRLLERVGESSGGFELAFDNWGRMYETHNLEHVSQLVFEGKYIEGLPGPLDHSLTNISDHDENGLARIYPVGAQETRVNHPEQSGYFSGACGITFYGGGRFPDGLNNNLFVADVVLNLIHIDILTSTGTHSVASRNREKVEFLASTDRSFRPVNMTVGPNGSLYVLDMHRAVIEHPEWIPDEIEAGLDLKEGKDMGRIYRILPKDTETVDEILWDWNDDATLLRALGNQNQWVRMTAQRLIVSEKRTDLTGQLEEICRSSTNDYAYLHALWCLDGLGKMSYKILQQALLHDRAEIRENGAIIAESFYATAPDFATNLIPLCKDEYPRVRLRAALALGRLPKEYFISYAREMFYVFQDMLDREDSDVWISMAAASAMQQQPLTFSRQILSHAKGKLGENNREALLSLCRLLGKSQHVIAMEVLINKLANSTELDGGDKTLIIDALAEGWGNQEAKGSLTPAGLASLDSLEEVADAARLAACGKFRKALNLPVSSQIRALMSVAKVDVLDESKSVDERKELLNLIGLEDFEKREEVLYKLLHNKQALELQEAAMLQLWLSDHPDVGAKLLNLWSSLGPESRKNAGNILLYKSRYHDLLVSALETNKINLGELNFDLERRRTLLWSDDEDIKQRAAKLFSDAGIVQRKEAMESMKPALDLQGDLGKGEVHFTHVCANCHQYGNLGKEVGPNLSEISRKSKASLMHDILDPNAAVDPRYLTHQIHTAQGNIYSGIIYKETDSSYTLRMTEGKEQEIAKRDVTKLRSLGISLMPEGLEEGLSPQDFADLLAFLQKQQ